MARKNEVEVLVTADVDQYEARMKAATESAAKLSKALRDTDKSANTLTNNIRRIAGNLSVMRGPLDGITGRVNAFATLVGSAGGAAAAASVSISALATSLAMGTRAAIENETAVARMNAVLFATGQVAGLTGSELEAMANRLSESTLASGLDARSAIAQLMTFRNISKTVFEDTLIAAQNLADSGFGSLQSNIETLGEAVDEPLQGMSALSEMGINFTNSQKQAIEAAVRMGDTLTAQKIILKEVDDRVKGVSETLKKTTAEGAFDNLAKQVKGFNKDIATAVGVLDMIKGSVNGMANAIKAVRSPMQQESLEDRISEAQQLLDLREKALAEAKGGGFLDQMGVKGLEANVDLARKQLEVLKAEQQAHIEKDEKAKRSYQEFEAARRAAAEKTLKTQQDAATAAAKAVADAQEVILKTAQGDPYAAENARFEAASAALEQKRLKATEDNLMDIGAINSQYWRAEEALAREHEEKIFNIERAEAAKRRAAKEGDLQDEIKARKDIADSQSARAALPGTWDAKREARGIQYEADLEENRLQMELLKQRGNATLLEEKALDEQLLLAQGKYLADLKALDREQEAEEKAAQERRLAAQRAAAAEAERIERERLAELERQRAAAMDAIQTEMKARGDLANVAIERAEMSGSERGVLDAQRNAALEQNQFEQELLKQRGDATLLEEEALAQERKLIWERYYADREAMDIRQWQMNRDLEEQRTEAMQAGREEELAYTADFFSKTNDLLIMAGQEATAAQKAMAITQATIMGIMAVQSVLADYTMPLPLKMAMIPVVMAMSAANVAKIAAQRAMGGPVAAGSSYLVGERGPEIFTPYAGGMISPGDRGAQQVVNIIENPQRGGQTERGSDGSMTVFVAAVKAEIARDIQRGTGIGGMVVRR